MQDITIVVSEAGTAAARTFSYKIHVAGDVVAERILTPVQTAQVQEMTLQYFSILEGAGQNISASAKGYLSLLRDGISHLFLDACGKDLASQVMPHARLIVRSSIPEVLQLPWELLALSSDGPGEIKDISVIRQTIAKSPSVLKLDPTFGPLRILFLAAESQDYEAEERSILEAACGLDMDVAICESATIEDLRDMAERFRPHLLHLAGQAKMSGGSAALSLESQKAGTNGAALLLADDLALALQGLGLFGVILSGRQSEPAVALHQLCQRLSETVPMAVAWDADPDRALLFYQSLAEGLSMEEAIRACLKESLSSFSSSEMRFKFASLPALYSMVSQSKIFSSQKMSAEPAVIPCREVSSIPGLNEGRADCFVGRRRDVARLLPGLRDGSIQALVITGPDGAGKSTFAVFLSRQMASLGYSILPLYSSPCNPITSTRLLDAAAVHFNGLGKDSQANDIKDSKHSVSERLQVLADALKSSKIIMLWDGLDLDCQSGKILDPDLAEFYLQMLRGLGTGRVIVTCMSLPADALTLPARAKQWELKGLYEAAFIRALLLDRSAANRYKMGEVSYAILAEHHHSASGLPSHLALIRRALALGDLAAGKDALSKIASCLTPESSHALSCSAVYGIAVSLEGFAAASSMSRERVAAAAELWQNLSLAHEAGGLWSVPFAIRKSLLKALSQQEQRDVDRRAASYLRELAESGRAAELGLSRLDLFMEVRGHYLDAGDLDSAAAVTSRISGYLRRRGYYMELIKLNREIFDRQPQSATSAAWIAQGQLDLGENRKAAEFYGQAIQIAFNPDFYHGLGLALLGGAKLDQAKEALQKAADAYRAAGDHSGESASLARLAEIDLKKGEQGAAILKLERIMEIMRLLEDVPGEAAVLQEAARLEMAGGKHDSARARIVRSLELLENAKDERGASFALFNLASLDLEKGDFTEAADEFTRALPRFREIGDQAAVAAILHSLGLIHSQAGEKEAAAKSFKEALLINQSLADRAAEAGAFFQLGALAVQQDRMAEGLRLMALAAIVLRSIKSEEVNNVEPLVEGLASQLKYSQEQFMVLVQDVLSSYAKDRGWGLVEKAWGKQE
jgi:tetratricopeptide (TPR) repeat protein